jgi:hypothetical protein
MAGYCTRCGAGLAGTERFCANCGTAIAAPAPPAQEAQEPTPSQPWGAAPPPAWNPPGASPQTDLGWRPPIAAPDQRPTSRGLAVALQVLLWISVAWLVIEAIVAGFVLASARDYYDAPVGFDFDEAQRWVDREDLAGGLIGLLSLFSIAVFVLLVIWAFQLTRAVNRHRPENRRWSPGWAIGAWFIPIASYVLCPMILWEDEKIATAGRGAPGTWQSVRPKPWIIVWFVGWLATVVLLTVGINGLGRTDEPTLPDRGAVMRGYTVLIIGALVGATTVAIAAVTVRRLTRLDHAADAPPLGSDQPAWV